MDGAASRRLDHSAVRSEQPPHKQKDQAQSENKSDDLIAEKIDDDGRRRGLPARLQVEDKAQAAKREQSDDKDDNRNPRLVFNRAESHMKYAEACRQSVRGRKNHTFIYYYFLF